MLHVDVPPLIIGVVVTLAGIVMVVFNRALLRRFPDRVSNLDWRGRDIVPNTRAGTIIIGAILVLVGILITLRGGLRLF